MSTSLIQDGRGSIWKVDLSFSLSMLKPTRVYRSHASSVTALVGLGGQFLVSGGADGTAYIYDLNRKALLNFVHYPAGVTCLQSVPLEIDPSGCLLLIGYEDGVVRLFAIESESASVSDAAVGGLYSVTKALSASFRLAAAHKPHTGPVCSVRVAAAGGANRGADRGAMATVGGGGNLFFFVLDLAATSGQQLTPTRCFQLPSQPASFDWWSLSSSGEVGATVTFPDGTLWLFTPKETASLLKEDANSDSFVADNVEPAASVSLFSLIGDFVGLEVHSASFLETDPNCLVVFARRADADEMLLFGLDPSSAANEVHSRARFVILSNGESKRGRTLTDATFCLGDTVLLVGYSDGAVRVHSLCAPYSASATWEVAWRLDNFWELPLHCPDRGAVRSVVHMNTEACGHLVGVSGGDGGIVLLEMSDIDFGASFETSMTAKTSKKVRALKTERTSAESAQRRRLAWGEAAVAVRYSDEREREEAVNKWRKDHELLKKRKSLASLPAADSVEDIEDPHHLSLEEEKRQRIEQQKWNKVEKDKLFIQRNLASLRNTFRALVKR